MQLITAMLMAGETETAKQFLKMIAEETNVKEVRLEAGDKTWIYGKDDESLTEERG